MTPPMTPPTYRPPSKRRMQIEGCAVLLVLAGIAWGLAAAVVGTLLVIFRMFPVGR